MDKERKDQSPIYLQGEMISRVKKRKVLFLFLMISFSLFKH